MTTTVYTFYRIERLEFAHVGAAVCRMIVAQNIGPIDFVVHERKRRRRVDMIDGIFCAGPSLARLFVRNDRGCSAAFHGDIERCYEYTRLRTTNTALLQWWCDLRVASTQMLIEISTHRTCETALRTCESTWIRRVATKPVQIARGRRRKCFCASAASAEKTLRRVPPLHVIDEFVSLDECQRAMRTVAKTGCAVVVAYGYFYRRDHFVRWVDAK